MLRLAPILFLFIPSFAAAETSPLNNLEALVGQWVELRQALADEERSWETRREQWELEIDLLEREKKQLQEEVASSGEAERSVQKRRAELIVTREGLKQRLEAIKPALDRSEAELRQWQQNIPPALQASLETAFLRLPASQAEAEKRSVPERFQLVLGLFSRIEQLQRELHTAQEILPIGENEKRQVDVIYLGLARGFAVSKDGSWAAVGTPGLKGWRWTPQPALAKEITRALKIARGEETAQLVELPMGVLEGRE